MEYDFKKIYRTFNFSYFSKDKDFYQNFVDNKELKQYEEIEKFTNDLIVILIKKFKLRLSFRENSDYSKEIIFSDDYNFQPNMLKNCESIIKIAIVKDNWDKWIHLSNYDYIFTFKEHINKLKQYDMVFPIEEQSSYNQIKFILNDLHVRKIAKFNNFVNKINFQKVFPRWEDYFKILNSDLFDDQWYHDTYNLTKNTDSVIHFLLIGYKKGNNPSSNFNTDEYYECNFDVKINGINPLVHYETFGREEDRIIRISDIDQRNYSIILNSPFFDDGWYRSTYDLDSNVDCVDHYLNVGYTMGFNPGPDFSTYIYWECNRDIKINGMNPLLHYELYGKNENRSYQFDDKRFQIAYSAIADSPFFDEEWYKSTYDLNDDVDGVDHYLNIGYAKGYNPGPDFDSFEYWRCNEDVKEYGMNPLAHYEIYGRKENRMILFSEMIERDYLAISDSPYFDELWYRSTYDMDSGVDCVDHYLNVGFTKGFNPGPDFSTYIYWECNLDIKEWKMNPLLHYELYGRNENRVFQFEEDRAQRGYSAIADSPFFDEEWYQSTYDIDLGVDCVDHYLNIGYAMGFNPGPDFDSFEYWQCNEDVKDYGMNPLAHYEIYGRGENRKYRLDDED